MIVTLEVLGVLCLFAVGLQRLTARSRGTPGTAKNPLPEAKQAGSSKRLGCFMALLILQTSSLPELPQVDLKDFPPVIMEQVQEAYDTARSHPRDAGASGKLGMLLELYKRREPAAICYERAHQLDPGEFRWLYYLGFLHSAQGKRTEALTTLRAALRLNPDYLPARLKLAENLLASAEWDEARKLYEAIVKGNPDAAEAYYGIGRIRAANGDLAAAVQSYRKACELFPAYGAAHYGLALAYRKLGDMAGSEEQLKLHAAGQTLVPPVPDPLRDELRALDRGAASLLQRGVRFQEAGRLEDAIAEHEKALEYDPQYVQAHANLIILYGMTHQPQKAEEHFRAAVRLNPNHADSYYNYGVLLFDEGKYDEAEGMFRKAIGSIPFMPRPCTIWASCWKSRADWKRLWSIIARPSSDSRATPPRTSISAESWLIRKSTTRP
jgi:tetratricopeptide (TPR) repeat protein